ncbi:MAG: hypothetical protein ACI392_03605 [Paludibacteraceae bacterium]
MKQKFFGVLLIAASLCVACDADTDPKQDNSAEQPATPEQPEQSDTVEIMSSQQYLRAATIFNNAFDESGAALRQVSLAAAAPARTASAEESAGSPKVTWVCDNGDNNFPVTVTVDYGETNVVGIDGRQHRGKMIVKATGAYAEQGTKLDVDFEGWYVDNIKVEADMTVENNGRDSEGHCQFEVDVFGGQLTANDTTVFEYAEGSLRTWIEGENEPDLTKHTYSIVGIQEGITSDGYEYSIECADDPMVVNVGTLFPLSGTLNVSVPTSSLETLFPDYADLLKIIYPETFEFQLVFVGDNKAKTVFTFTNPGTGELQTIESEPYDLTATVE